MKIEDHNDLNILFFAFRYALGRQTAAPSLVIDKIKESWEEFPIHDKEKLLKETTQYLDMEFGNTVSLDEWGKFQIWCKNKIREANIDVVIS